MRAANRLKSGCRTKPVSARHEDACTNKGTLTYVWGEKGKRPRAPRDQRYDCAYIFGAVCPARGKGAALVMPHADTWAMNKHLAEISGEVARGAHAIVIIDGAGWHTTKSLIVPDNISLMRLPAYSPELNPQENIWQYLRQNALANRCFENYDAIVQACCKAWNDLIALPETIKSIASREWFEYVRS
jgi:transposase